MLYKFLGNLHFVLISMSVSTDIDECAASAYCPANSTCSNQPGSFECFCDLGYIMQNSLCVGEYTPLPHLLSDSCHLLCKDPFADVDECAENHTLCGDAMQCVNTDGSYQCDCYPGYMKDDTGVCRGEASNLW